MKKLASLLMLAGLIMANSIQAQQALWFHNPNRFEPHDSVALEKYDSIIFTRTGMRFYYKPEYKTSMDYYTRNYQTKYDYNLFERLGHRYLLKPSTYAGTDYQNESATHGYNFLHSVESEHFVVFWDVRFGNNPRYIKHPNSGDVANAYNVLDVAERCWNNYVEELGFLVPGASITDHYKIQLYIPYQSDWRADASGVDGAEGGKTGIGHFNPSAANARGGHTIAHEVAHTFQYLVEADLGSDHGYGWGFNGDGWGDCGWWESCADWQAYQIFPDRQFTDGEYFEQHLDNHHLNLLHEDWRYACCYIQDWWCMKHGRDFIGRLGRNTNKAEDLVQTYQRLNNLSQAQFCDELMEGYMRMATWDIDGVRERAAHRIGQHHTYLNTIDKATATYQADVDHCIQNYGYAIINMSLAEAGTVVKAHFKGLTDATGYRYVNPEKAGWRYAFVALQADGIRHYGEVKTDKEGVAELTVPSNCTHLFFVVMGAPTEHWQHPWDRNKSASSWTQNGEQWPYQVRFENTNKYGEYGEYPADYVRRDTTVTINVDLPYDASSYSSVNVPYSIEAASKALGLSSDHLHAVACNSSANPGFIAINNSNSNITANTTTSTSSATVLGHWFNASGNVCGYDSNAQIYAEFMPATFQCKVGQYPGRLVTGRTYTIKQGIRYKPTGSSKYYTCTYLVKINVK